MLLLCLCSPPVILYTHHITTTTTATSLLEDKGANPDAYTKDYLEHVVAENQFARGKLGAFKHFADVLQGDLAEAYPEEAAAYSRITGVTKSEAVQEDREESVDVTTIAP
jgi:hypothetical protein